MFGQERAGVVGSETALVHDDGDLHVAIRVLEQVDRAVAIDPGQRGNDASGPRAWCWWRGDQPSGFRKLC